jgi:hypothetical protein
VCIECDRWLDEEISAGTAGQSQPIEWPKTEPDMAEVAR